MPAISHHLSFFSSFIPVIARELVGFNLNWRGDLPRGGPGRMLVLNPWMVETSKVDPA